MYDAQEGSFRMDDADEAGMKPSFQAITTGPNVVLITLVGGCSSIFGRAWQKKLAIDLENSQFCTLEKVNVSGGYIEMDLTSSRQSLLGANYLRSIRRNKHVASWKKVDCSTPIIPTQQIEEHHCELHYGKYGAAVSRSG